MARIVKSLNGGDATPLGYEWEVVLLRELSQYYRVEYESGHANAARLDLTVYQPGKSVPFFSADVRTVSDLGRHTENPIDRFSQMLVAAKVETLAFDLFIIHSWDGRSTGQFGPDIWTLSADGTTLFNTTFANGNTAGQSFPGSYPGGNYPKQTGASEINTLGYGSPSDSVYHLSGTATHSGNSVTINFSASDLEALSDESWGIDNVSISADITTPSVSGATSVNEGSAYPSLMLRSCATRVIRRILCARRPVRQLLSDNRPRR